MKNNKLCKQLCDMVDMYQDSEHPINEILSAMKLNIQDILEENLTKHNNDFKKPCPDCLGKGKLEDFGNVKMDTCPTCKGQGFIKS